MSLCDYPLDLGQVTLLSELQSPSGEFGDLVRRSQWRVGDLELEDKGLPSQQTVLFTVLTITHTLCRNSKCSDTFDLEHRTDAVLLHTVTSAKIKWDKGLESDRCQGGKPLNQVRRFSCSRAETGLGGKMSRCEGPEEGRGGPCGQSPRNRAAHGGLWGQEGNRVHVT